MGDRPPGGDGGSEGGTQHGQASGGGRGRQGKGGLGPLLEEARRQGVDVQQVPRQTLDRVAAGLNHQGVAAQAEPWRYAELEELFQRAEERDEPPLFSCSMELKIPIISDPSFALRMLRVSMAW